MSSCNGRGSAGFIAKPVTRISVSLARPLSIAVASGSASVVRAHDSSNSLSRFSVSTTGALLRVMFGPRNVQLCPHRRIAGEALELVGVLFQSAACILDLTPPILAQTIDII